MAWRRTRLTLIIAACVVGTLAGLAPAATAVAPQAGATRLGSAPATQRVSLVLPLTADLAGLEQFATAVTTAGSARYGQFEPITTLARQYGATASDRARVIHYLRREGAQAVKIDATGLFADATMNVAQAQRLFGTPLARFATAGAERFIAPTGTVHVPAALRGAVTDVVGLDTQPLFSAPRVTSAGGFPHTVSRDFRSDHVPSAGPRTGTPAGCSGALDQTGFTPNQYLTAYGYTPLQEAQITGQDERVALIEIDGFRYTDLRSFAACFRYDVPAVNAYGVGLAKPLAPGGETTLDLELLDAVAPNLKAIDVYESGSRAADVLRSLTAPLQIPDQTPEVISASLGTCEALLLESIGYAGVRAAEGALAAAAASGISVLASSGDNGSSACPGTNGPLDALAVSYPASSPFVTGVGGTNLTLTAANTIADQPVWNDAPDELLAGGGGVSGLFTRPSYQKGFEAVNRRTVPDVSMLADVQPGYDIYCTAKGDCLNKVNPSNPWVAVGGTSAAAPLFAGGLALVDQALRQQGRQQLGNADSLLYEIARSRAKSAVFDDVTTGDNDLGPYFGDHKALGCCTARRGYDDASGLGSVNLAQLAVAATELQARLASVGVSLPRQRPLARHHLLARVTCSRHCLVASIADVTVDSSESFTVRSSIYVLGGKGAKQVKLSFSNRELGELKAALRAHSTPQATVFGAIVDSGGNIERVSRGRKLRITS